MLVRLSDSIRPQLTTLAQDPGFVLAVSNLLRAHREGKHVVCGDRRLLNGLSKILTGPRELADLTVVTNKLYESNALEDVVSAMVVVEPRNDSQVAVDQSAQRITYRLPFSSFTDSASSQAAVLLGENTDDAQVYRWVARGFLTTDRALRRMRMSVRLDLQAGGGSTTPDCLQSLCEQGRFVLCVVDRDSGAPDAAVGDTAKLAASRRVSQPGWVAHVETLAAREIENILPRNVFLEALEDAPDTRKRYQQMLDLGIGSGQEDSLYLDLKAGLKLGDYLFADSPVREYLSVVIRRLRKSYRHLLPEVCDDSAPGCSDRKDCVCILFRGIGGKALSHAADLARKNSPHRFAGGFDFSPGKPWARPAELAVAWGLAYPVKRV